MITEIVLQMWESFFRDLVCDSYSEIEMQSLLTMVKQSQNLENVIFNISPKVCASLTCGPNRSRFQTISNTPKYQHNLVNGILIKVIAEY